MWWTVLLLGVRAAALHLRSLWAGVLFRRGMLGPGGDRYMLSSLSLSGSLAFLLERVLMAGLLMSE
jgi:hypothetical protein